MSRYAQGMYMHGWSFVSDGVKWSVNKENAENLRQLSIFVDRASVLTFRYT